MYNENEKEVQEVNFLSYVCYLGLRLIYKIYICVFFLFYKYLVVNFVDF